MRINELRSDTVLATDIYGKGNFFIPRQTKLTSKVIEELQANNITEVTVLKPSEEKGNFSIRYMDEYRRFQDECLAVLGQMKLTFQGILADDCKHEDIYQLTTAMFEFYLRYSDSTNLIDMLQALKDLSDDTYIHSISVAMLSAVLGKWLGWNERDCELLLACGLFHDVGKLAIPRNILKKPGRLTAGEYEIVKKHSVLGYRMLQNLELNPHVKQTALLHHERCDGSGYPLQRSRNELDRYVKIISIADVYDGMTADRCYRKGYCPFGAIDNFEKEGLHLFEASYIKAFIKGLLLAHSRDKVMLNDGRQGEIVMINEDSMSKPVVMIDNECVDLSIDKSLQIFRVII